MRILWQTDVRNEGVICVNCGDLCGWCGLWGMVVSDCSPPNVQWYKQLLQEAPLQSHHPLLVSTNHHTLIVSKCIWLLQYQHEGKAFLAVKSSTHLFDMKHVDWTFVKCTTFTNSPCWLHVGVASGNVDEYFLSSPSISFWHAEPKLMGGSWSSSTRIGQ